MKRRTFLLQLPIISSGLFNNNITIQQSKKPVLNVFLAVDFSQKDREKDRRADLNAMESFFKDRGKIAGMEVRIQTFINRDFSPQHLLEAINKLGDISKNQPPNSGIVVYFSGHGANSGKGEFPHLSFGDRSITMSKLNDIVTERKARLSFVLADCCNNLIKDMLLGASQTEGETNEYLVKKLLWDFGPSNIRKSILICAAQKGDFSYSSPVGSLFQQTFRRSFSLCTSNKFTNTSWEMIRNQTMNELDKTLKRQSKNTSLVYHQSPIFSIFDN